MFFYFPSFKKITKKNNYEITLTNHSIYIIIYVVFN